MKFSLSGFLSLRSAARIWRRKDGNVAMIFAVMALPMLGGVGLAVDFGSILSARNKAQVAADAAALQAGGVARDLIRSGDGSAASVAAAIAQGERRGRLLFDANAAQLGLTDYEATVKVTRSGQTLSSRASFKVHRATYLAPLFGMDSFEASDASVSSVVLPTYSEVYVAVDVSQSMGIAATTEEMSRLFYAKVKLKNGKLEQTSCVFGCHAKENSDHTETYSDVAAREGIRLRIDVLRDATVDLVETARRESHSDPLYRIGLFAMGMSANYSTGALITLHDLSGDFDSLAAAARKITLGPSKGNPYSDSYQNETVAQLNQRLTAAGDGTSPEQPKKYVIIITDGVRDVQKGSGCVQTGNRCVSALEQASCSAMKAKGITVGVLYTTYLPPRPYTGTDWYAVQVVNTGVAAKVPTALKNCASPGWYYEASQADAIDAALQRMFAQTRAEPMLTQ